ncbi:MAG: OmpA family protein [Polaribacter sp.]|nr:OmpA family protein [Polaribacter sp.]
MKKLILVIIIVFANGILFAQKTVGGKVVDNAKNKTFQKGEQKGDEIIDNTLNNIEDGIKNIFKKKKKKTVVEEPKEEIDKTKNVKKNQSNSKFDFEPGKKQLAFDDFSTTEFGDFPLDWNTNSSAEMRTLDDSNQKWFAMTKDGFFTPEYVKDMPENFTIEFDVFTRYNSNNLLTYSFYLNAVDNPKKDLDNKYIQNGVYFGWRPCVGAGSFFVYENGEIINKNEDLNIKEFEKNDCEEATTAKVSIWRQKGRLRLYINETKILDIPQAFDTKLKYNSFKFGTAYMNFSNGAENSDEFMVSNIRYAVAGEDTRSKLITEGRFVTNGILFEVNSENIKPESGAVLKEIATTLQENPTIRVKIIGHTDSDGSDIANLSLSQKRANAVKIALSSFYGIDISRFEIEGKGESQPLNKNETPEEKAQNRRVEFIKL